MLKKIFIILALVSILCFVGCKKSPETTTETPAETAKTAEEYKADAQKQITEDNMNSSLDSLEKEIKTDVETQ